MDQGKRIVAVFVLLAAALAIAFYVVTGSDDGDGDGDGVSRQTAPCSLGARDMGLVVEGLLDKKSTAVIVISVGGGASIGEGCSSVIETLVEAPAKPVTVAIETSDGSPAEKTFTATQLLVRTPASTESGSSCFDWKSRLLFEMCRDGQLPAPEDI